jgi:methionyl aminopeptidase
MITIKSNAEIIKMKAAGALLKDVLSLLEENIKIGITTAKLDQIAYDYITAHGAQPSFLNYKGYPASICTSIDEVVVHGIPSQRKLEEGQIIGIDAGVYLDGFHSDAARTFAVGRISPLKRKLIEIAEKSFFDGVKVIKEGARLGDLGSAIQKTVEENGFSVVREMIGHGIGAKMHEDPEVPNYGEPGRGIKLQRGMTIAVEPMINAGDWRIKWLDDGWTVVTSDKSPSAHYENTVLVTADGYEIFTV